MSTQSIPIAFEKTIIQQLNAISRPVKASVLAEMLGLSKITVYKMAAKGSIPSFRIGTAVRFDCRAVARWLAGAVQGGAL
jgi:excisionase family DNA binding protein